MASQKQLEANRRNALHSTGPKTQVGLQVVARNALKHGVFSSRFPVLPHEEVEDYETLKTQLMQDFQVQTAVEQILIERMAQSCWKKQRLLLFEQQLLEAQQIEHTWTSQEKGRQLQDCDAVQLLQSEISILTQEIECIGECLSECQAYNRMRPGKKRDEAGNGLESYIHNVLEEACDRLAPFLDSHALNDAKREHQKYPEGRYARTLFSAAVAYSDDDDAQASYPISTYTLEKMLEALEKRLETLEARVQHILQKQEIEAQLAAVGLNLLPNEEHLAKLQRYESYLDNQFFKALHELQKLQAFLLQKKTYRMP